MGKLRREIEGSAVRISVRETQNKMRGVVPDEEKLTRSRAKIIGLTSASMGPTWDCVSDMYTDTKHFSTTTMSAINNISEHAKYKKKSDYTWRKDMEDFEHREQKIRDMRSRSIGGVQRRRKESSPLKRVDHDNAVTSLTARRPPLPATTTAMAKSKTERKGVTFGSESQEKTQQQRSLNAPPPPERKSGREDEEERFEIDREDDAKKVTTSETMRKVRENVPSANSDETYDVKMGPADEENKKEEEEDIHGTKKLRSDFHGMMGSLEQEMEAGKSKLAKLRERIRKARGAIMAADDAMKADEEERRQKAS